MTLSSNGFARLRRTVIGTDIKFTVHVGPTMIIMTENMGDAVSTFRRLTVAPQP